MYMNSFEKPENLNRELNKAARYEQKKSTPLCFYRRGDS